MKGIVSKSFFWEAMSVSSDKVDELWNHTYIHALNAGSKICENLKYVNNIFVENKE